MRFRDSGIQLFAESVCQASKDAASPFALLCDPGIHDGRNMFKMRGITRRQSGMMSEYDTGNHGVAEIARTAFFVPGCHQITCLLRGCIIENRHTTPNSVEKHFKALHKGIPPFAGRHDLQTEPDFEGRDGGYPNRRSRLPVKPRPDPGVGRLQHQCGQNIRV